MERRPANGSTEWPTLRVFVSSTFADMEAERERLAKRAFPRVARMAADHRVRFQDIDLRWGIQESRIERGELLDACLDEIDRCGRYMICVIGHRYGSLIETIPAASLTRRPWLGDLVGRSVTEMEIRHAMRRPRNEPTRLFFYLRRLALETRPGSAGPSFDGADRLRDLRDEVSRSRHVVREYTEAAELEALVVRDLADAISIDFHDRLRRDEEKEDLEQRALVEARNAYVPDAAVQDALHRFADGKTRSRGLVLTGLPGSGKSSTLAHWLNDRRSPATEIVVEHFVGPTRAGAYCPAMLARIVRLLGAELGWPRSREVDEHVTASSFMGWLERARIDAAGRRILIVIDGIDDLIDPQGVLGLSWLPDPIADGIRFVLSSSPTTADRLGARGWARHDLRRLEPPQRHAIVLAYLDQYGKQLEDDLVRRLASCDACENPGFLLTVLQELRLFGSHDRLRMALDELLAASSMRELLDRILERWKRDYDPPRTVPFVAWALACLEESRDGLGEDEILALGGAGLEDSAPKAREKLSESEWIPLLSALAGHTSWHDGRLVLSSPPLRDAVRARCSRQFPRDELHLRKAEVLVGLRGGMDGRRMAEVLWSSSEAGIWSFLVESLLDPKGLVMLLGVGIGAAEIGALWARIERSSAHRMTVAYSDVEHHEDGTPEALAVIGALLFEAGHLPEALRVRRAAVERARSSDSKSLLGTLLGELAASLIHDGDLAAAGRLLEESRALADGGASCRGQVVAIGLLAIAQHRRGLEEESLRSLDEAQRLATDCQAYDLLPMCHANRALVYQALGRFPEALSSNQEEERRCRMLGDKAGVGRALSNQAQILVRLGSAERACATIEQAIGIWRELGSMENLQGALFVSAQVLHKARRTAEAFEHIGESIAIAEAANMRKHLADALLIQCRLLLATRKHQEAKRVGQRVLELAKALDREDLECKAKQVLWEVREAGA